MPIFRVEALEKFVVRTFYYIEAPSARQAEKLCRSGQVAYEHKTIEDGDEEWLKTVAVEEI